MHNIKLILFDMDGTAVRYKNSSFHSSWDAIGYAAGCGDKWDEYLEYYLPKPELYEEWFEKNCEAIKGAETKPVYKAIFPPPYTPGFREFSRAFSYIEQGILSSGVNIVADKIKEDLDLSFAIANVLHTQNGNFTGTGEVKVHIKDKGTIIQKVMDERGLERDQVAFFGDYINDISAWRVVGNPYGVNVKHEDCHQYIDKNFDDFFEALFLFD